MVLSYNREQLVQKYQGKLYNSRNSLATEQAAKARCRATSTGDIQGRDESPICQGWFRCNQICHNVQQWPGWCTRGLFSPKWVCDLSLVLIPVCGTLYVCLCSVPNVPMCTGLYCQSSKRFLSLSCQLTPSDLFLLHFHVCFLIADPLFQCALLPLFVFISHTLVSAFMLLPRAWSCAHMPLFVLTALFSSCLSSSESSGWRRAGRRRIFLSVTELLEITQFGFEGGLYFFGNTPVPWVYDAWEEVEH